jgi:hypothetical protein
VASGIMGSSKLSGSDHNKIGRTLCTRAFKNGARNYMLNWHRRTLEALVAVSRINYPRD